MELEEEKCKLSIFVGIYFTKKTFFESNKISYYLILYIYII